MGFKGKAEQSGTIVTLVLVLFFQLLFIFEELCGYYYSHHILIGAKAVRVGELPVIRGG